MPSSEVIESMPIIDKNMKVICRILLLIVLPSVILSACTPRVEVDHRMSEGNIDFLCDESYANVLEQHV